ncbi:MAG TPA: ATP-binding protein [Vicinamibacterales bacterium]|nr:ATP-binding protein [Vicinamibacterales bacterium]
MNDLVVVMALPAVWVRDEPSQIARTLLNALLRLLQADVVYLHLIDGLDGLAKDWARSLPAGRALPDSVRRSLADSAGPGTREQRIVLHNPFGDGDMWAAIVPLGVAADLGAVVAASRRPDFPTTSERLVMQVAANQATIALQDARRLWEQRRALQLLERRVTRRTAELAAANDELRRSEQRYALATTAGGVGVWDWDLSTGRMYVDPPLKRALGFEDHEIANDIDSWAAHVHPDDAGLVGAQAQAVIDGTLPLYEVEHRMVHRDGSVRWFLARGSVIRASDGRAIRMVGTDTDITERKQAELRLQETHHELARVSRLTALGQFAASIAHEVSQPLGSILMDARACLRMLDRPDLPVDEIATVIRDIADAGTRAREIMRRNRELFVNRSIQKAPVDVNAVVRDVVEQIRSRCANAHIRVTLSLRDVGLVMGDRVELQQVLLNLLLNAADALDAVQGRRRTIEIGSSAADGAVRIAVRDNGVGLAAVDLARLFTPAYTTKPSGGGVGLSISRSIVEAHGGTLSAEPNHPHGSVFSVTIPARPLEGT